jgi:hypothetical protein
MSEQSETPQAPPKKPSQPEKAPEKASKGRVIKYMGMSDVRNFYPGETLLGRTAPLDTYVEWRTDNNHLVNTDDYPSVPAEFWDALVGGFDQPTFADVTEAHTSSDKSVPKGDYETVYRPEGFRPKQSHT